VNFFRKTLFSNNLWFMHGCELWTISIILSLEMCHIFVGGSGMKSFGYEKISHSKTKTKKEKSFEGRKNL
jgi:hypothetical protein